MITNELPGPGRHLPELDGLRALAILSVFVFHARGVNATSTTTLQEVFFRVTEVGWVGVDLFFVLSGFLITGILLDTRQEPHFFKSFFARRALRILPLYYGVLALVFVCVHAGWVAGSTKGEPYFWCYLQNWLRTNPEPYHVRILNHFWSLAIEEQFYLVWPILIWALPRRAIPWMCGIAIVIAALSRALLVHGGVFDAQTVHFLTFARVDTLAIGGLLAALVRQPVALTHLRRWFWPTLGASLGGVLAVAIMTGHFRAEDEEMVWWGYLSIDLLFAATIAASVLFSFPAWRLFLCRPKLMWIGKISYGAYVFHWPVMVLLGKVWPKARLGFWPNQLAWWLATLALTLVIAFVSFSLYESRFLALKNRFRADGVVRRPQPASRVS